MHFDFFHHLIGHNLPWILFLVLFLHILDYFFLFFISSAACWCCDWMFVVGVGGGVVGCGLSSNGSNAGTLYFSNFNSFRLSIRRQQQPITTQLRIYATKRHAVERGTYTPSPPPSMSSTLQQRVESQPVLFAKGQSLTRSSSPTVERDIIVEHSRRLGE